MCTLKFQCQAVPRSFSHVLLCSNSRSGIQQLSKYLTVSELSVSSSCRHSQSLGVSLLEPHLSLRFSGEAEQREYEHCTSHYNYNKFPFLSWPVFLCRIGGGVLQSCSEDWVWLGCLFTWEGSIWSQLLAAVGQSLAQIEKSSRETGRGGALLFGPNHKGWGRDLWIGSG